MAEVFRALSPNDAGFCLPAAELSDEHRREVYEAVANDLDFSLRFGGVISGGSVYLELADGRPVSFSFGLVDSEPKTIL